MLRIAIILGSTRPGRIGEGVAKWVYENAKKREGVQYELVDVADFKLPLLDEARLPGYGQYEKEHTLVWAKKIAQFDGFVFVTAEYNHGIPGALKNALDYLYAEWNNKAAGLVSYGSGGGLRAAEHLRGVLGELMVADVRQQVALHLITDFEDFSRLVPKPWHVEDLNTLLDQVESWSGALKGLR